MTQRLVWWSLLGALPAFAQEPATTQPADPAATRPADPEPAAATQPASAPVASEPAPATQAVVGVATTQPASAPAASQPASAPAAPDPDSLPRDRWYIGAGVRLGAAIPQGDDVRQPGSAQDEFTTSAGVGLEIDFELADLLQFAAIVEAGGSNLQRQLFTETGFGDDVVRSAQRFGGALRLQPWSVAGFRPFLAFSAYRERTAITSVVKGDCRGNASDTETECSVEYLGWSYAPGLGVRYEGATSPAFGADETHDIAALFLQFDYSFTQFDDFEARPAPVGLRPDLAGAGAQLRYLRFVLGAQYLL